MSAAAAVATIATVLVLLAVSAIGHLAGIRKALERIAIALDAANAIDRASAVSARTRDELAPRRRP